MTSTVRRRLQQHLFRVFRNYETKKHPLTYLFWECTLRCNLSCLHCGSDCKRSSTVPDMPAEDFFKALDTLKFRKDSITVVLTGGEPLLRPDLAACGMALRKRGFRWGMVSNGLAYDATVHNNMLNAGMGALTFSLDGLEASHNRLRNHSDSFIKVNEAISIVVKSPRIQFDIVTCVHHGNINELESLYNFLLEKGVKAWRLFTIAPIGRAAKDKGLRLENADMLTLFRFIESKRKEKRMDIKFSCEGYTGSFEGRVRDTFFFCRAGINIASVLADGSISACPNINRSFVQGSVYKDRLQDVWDKGFGVFRKRRWARQGVCTACKEFKFCNGNGLHLHKNTTDDVMVCHYRMTQEALKEVH